MTKIKIPKPEIPLSARIEKTVQKYLSLFPDEASSMELELKNINQFLSVGVLKEDNYQLFQHKRHRFEINLILSTLREEYIRNYGFFIVSEGFINASKSLLKSKKVLEVGAGSGFLSACLQQEGIDITPTDISIHNNHFRFAQHHTEILEVDSIKYLKENAKNYDTVVMSWPNYESPFANNILKNMISGQQLLYIGERMSGCTANDQFFNRLEKRTSLLENETNQLQETAFRWPGLHDRPYLYEIK